jgi:hypothetical protein
VLENIKGITKKFKNKQEVLGRTNVPTFPMAVVATVTLAKDCM